MNRFLHFWAREIEGKLHSVRVAAVGIIAPADLKYCSGQFVLH